MARHLPTRSAALHGRGFGHSRTTPTNCRRPFGPAQLTPLLNWLRTDAGISRLCGGNGLGSRGQRRTAAYISPRRSREIAASRLLPALTGSEAQTAKANTVSFRILASRAPVPSRGGGRYLRRAGIRRIRRSVSRKPASSASASTSPALSTSAPRRKELPRTSTARPFALITRLSCRSTASMSVAYLRIQPRCFAVIADPGSSFTKRNTSQGGSPTPDILSAPTLAARSSPKRPYFMTHPHERQSMAAQVVDGVEVGRRGHDQIDACVTDSLEPSGVPTANIRTPLDFGGIQARSDQSCGTQEACVDVEVILFRNLVGTAVRGVARQRSHHLLRDDDPAESDREYSLDGILQFPYDAGQTGEIPGLPRTKPVADESSRLEICGWLHATLIDRHSSANRTLCTGQYAGDFHRRNPYSRHQYRKRIDIHADAS